MALVVLFHAEIPGVGGGYVGVDVFFVISGFLISTHLLESLRDRGQVGFGEFYARRARRLLPAAFAVIVATVIAAVVWVSPLQFEVVVKDAVAATFYVPNLLFAFRATDYLADTTPSLFMHYWSLGVEEQFYLLWPALLLWLFRRFGLRWRMAIALAVVGAASFALCGWLTVFSQPNAFFLLFPRMWEFGLGALVAFALLKRQRIFGERIGALAGWAGLTAIVGSGVLFTSATDYPGYAVALPVVGTALVIAAGPVRRGPAVILSIRPLTWIGDISYSLYLVHWPLLVIPLAASGYMHGLPMWVRGAIVVACVPLAWLLYTYVEQPGRRVAWLAAARPRRTLRVTVAAMAAITAVALTASALYQPVLDAGRSAPAMALTVKPAGTAFVPDNLRPELEVAAHSPHQVPALENCHRGLWAVDPANCVIGSDPAAPLVTLFGDSHAAQWYPALAVLANRGAIRLADHTKSTCPAAQIEVRHYPRCDVWRAAVMRKIAADKPALILLGNRDSSYLVGVDDPAWVWRRALTNTIKQFPVGSKVAMIADTPSIGVEPELCLGLHLDNALRCALPRNSALYRPTRNVEREMAAAGTFVFLDFTKYFCNVTVCPAILGNTLAYHDGHHITVDVAEQLAPVVDASVMAILGPARGSGPGMQPVSPAAMVNAPSGQQVHSGH